MKRNFKVSLLSLLVVFAFTLSGCFIDETKWPGFTVDFNPDTITEPGPEEDEPDDHDHIYSEWKYDAIDHWRVCSICGATEPGSKETHTFSTVVTTDPTCTNDGYTTYTCACGYSYEGSPTTSALGHIWGSWESVNDTYHQRTCSRCHDTETVEHDYEVISVSNITINDLAIGDITATYDYTCSVCDHNMTAENQPYTLNFANDPWEIIDEVSTEGYASTYYKVGDTKTITIGEEDHDIRIIDFNHDILSSTDGDEGGTMMLMILRKS